VARRRQREAQPRPPRRAVAQPALAHGRPWLPVVLVLASAAVFLGLLSAEWVFDDMTLAFDTDLGRWSVWGLLAQGLHEHPVRGVTLLLDYTLFGSSPAAFRAHNIVWHAIATLLLYTTVRKLSGRVLLAFFAALVFAVHPAHVEAVATAWHRKEPLCLAFSLASFLSYMRFIEASGRDRWWWLVAALVSLYLALASKQVAVALPPSLLVYEWLFVPPAQRFLFRKPLYVIGVGAAAAALVVTYLVTAGYFSQLDQIITLDGYRGEATTYTVALTSARMFWRYLYILAFPIGLCPDYLVPLSRSLTSPVTALAWLGFVAVIVGGMISARRWPLFAFGLAWFVIHFLPISNLIPSTYLLADRYLYVPSAGFCLALACLGAGLFDRLRERWGAPRATWVTGALGGLLILGYAGQTISYTNRWQSNLTLMSYTLETCNPHSHRAHTYLGIERAKLADPRGAERYFARAIELSERPNPFAHVNRGSVRLALKNYRGAAADFSLAIDAGLDSAPNYYKLGNSYFNLQRFSDAIEQYDTALEHDPSLAEAYRERALCHANLGRTALADADTARALELRPDWTVPALLELAESQRRLGDVEAEIQYLSRAARSGSSRAVERLKQRGARTGDVRFFRALVE